MAKRTSLLGRSRPSREADQGGDRRTQQGDPASRAAGEAAWEEWWWSALHQKYDLNQKCGL